MPFFISKRALVAAPAFVGRSMIAPALFFMHGRSYMSISAEEKVCYLREAAIVLAKEGFQLDEVTLTGCVSCLTVRRFVK